MLRLVYDDSRAPPSWFRAGGGCSWTPGKLEEMIHSYDVKMFTWNVQISAPHPGPLLVWRREGEETAVSAF